MDANEIGGKMQVIYVLRDEALYILTSVLDYLMKQYPNRKNVLLFIELENFLYLLLCVSEQVFFVLLM